MPNLLTALALAAALAHPQQPAPPQKPATPPPTAPAATPVEDPAVTALARKIYAQMRAGKVDPTLLTDQMNEGLTPDKLASVKPMFDQLGDPTKLTLQTRETIPQGTLYDYLAEFATAQLHVKILIDAAGRVAGYFVTLRNRSFGHFSAFKMFATAAFC